MNWFAATLVLLFQLLLVCWFDFTKMIIPNLLNLLLLLSGLVVRHAMFDEALLAILMRPAAVYGCFWAISEIYAKLRQRQGLGRGDVKFLAASAAWVELAMLPWVVLIASISGLAYALIAGGTRGGIGGGTRLAFGPHLALGLIVTWVLLRY